MDFNQIINTVKRRSESIAAILFYITAGFCFFFYVGNFNGSFMPVLGTLISMALEVGLWLLIPVLISVRRRSIAKWAFLGLSIFWVLTTTFSLLDATGFATAGAGGLACSVGVFSFLIACALIVTAVFATIAYWKKDKKMKLVALFIYLGTLVLLLVLFALYVALYANWRAGWNRYFGLIYQYILIPVAMCFAALAFWFDEGELCFAIFEKKPAEAKEEKPAEAKAEKSSEVKAEKPQKKAKVAEKKEVKEELPEAEESLEEVTESNEDAAEEQPAAEENTKAEE